MTLDPNALDRWITGNWGEDQFDGEGPDGRLIVREIVYDNASPLTGDRIEEALRRRGFEKRRRTNRKGTLYYWVKTTTELIYGEAEKARQDRLVAEGRMTRTDYYRKIYAVIDGGRDRLYVRLSRSLREIDYRNEWR